MFVVVYKIFLFKYKIFFFKITCIKLSYIGYFMLDFVSWSIQKILFYKVMDEITFVFVLQDTYCARFDFHSQTIDIRQK